MLQAEQRHAATEIAERFCNHCLRLCYNWINPGRNPPPPSLPDRWIIGRSPTLTEITINHVCPLRYTALC